MRTSHHQRDTGGLLVGVYHPFLTVGAAAMVSQLMVASGKGMIAPGVAA